MIRNIWKRNWIWMTAVTIGLLGAVLAAGMSRVKAVSIQQGIAGEIIRFHVLANSDSEEDQALKMHVKDTVVGYMKEVMGDVDSVEQSREIINANMENIRQKAEQEIAAQGYDYNVTAALTTAYFPQKSYGDCTFPSGDYEALQIKIGKASGHNWWCVVYPSLCFTDAVQGVVTEEKKEELKKVLTEEEYQNILLEGRVKMRFRWIKW